MKVRILAQDEVMRAVSMAQAIDMVKEAFVQLSLGQAVMPDRTHMDVTKHGGTLFLMPGYLTESDDLGVKIMGVFPGNHRYGFPVSHSLMVLIDACTGYPVAIMDATHITTLRTGAASGVATDLLARKDARVAAIIGTGAQARFQLQAICEVRHITQVWVYGNEPQSTEAFCQEMRGMGGRIPKNVTPAVSAAAAVQEADVICTATTAVEPVFADADLKAGTHINAIGAINPHRREVPTATICRARVVVDCQKACWNDAGDLIMPRQEGLFSEDKVYAEIGEIARGVIPGRQGLDEITLFKSVGLAIQDVAVARKVLDEAKQRHLGLEVEFLR